MLAITVIYDEITGILTFTGDAENDQLTVTASIPNGGTFSFESATDTSVSFESPKSRVTAIAVNLGEGTNDMLAINGSHEAEKISINGNTVKFDWEIALDVTYSLTKVENLTVDGRLNNDTITAAGTSVVGELSISGGAGTDALSVSAPLTVGGLAIDDPEGDDVELMGAGTAGIMTIADQTYDVPVTLIGNATLAGNDITFNNTLNSAGTPRALEVNTTGGGITTFGGRVGGTFPLSSLTTNADGTTIINGASITTTGAQIYNDPVTLNESAGAHFFTSDSGPPHRTIRQYDTNGRFLRSFNVSTAGELRGVAFGPDGLLYAPFESPAGFDAGVVAFDLDGTVHETYHFPEPLRFGNASAGKIAFDSTGHFYVVGFQFQIGFPHSGRLIGPYGSFDVEVLPNGNLLLADDYEVREVTVSGTVVRSIAPPGPRVLVNVRGVEYDAVNNHIFVTLLGESGGYSGILKLDATTGVVLDTTAYAHADDVWLTDDGRLIAGSRTLPPAVFDLELNHIGTFEGDQQRFVTQLTPTSVQLKSTTGSVTFNSTLSSSQNDESSLTIHAGNDVTFNASVGVPVEILDQQWTDVVRGTTYTGFNADWGMPAQTFTPSTAGLLSRVDVHVSTQGDLTNHNDLEVSIWNTVGGFPSSLLGSVTIPESTFPAFFEPAWITADFSSLNISVRPTDPLAIVLNSLGEKHYAWYGTLGEPSYRGGKAVSQSAGSQVWTDDLLEEHYSRLFRQFVIPAVGGRFDNLAVTAGNDVILPELRALNTVEVSAGGAITDGNGVANNIAAASLVTTAVTGISLDTTVANLTARNTTSGGIDINETNDVNALLLSAPGQTATLVAGGSIDTTTVNAGTANLTAVLAINDANGATVNATGATLNATAANGINLDTAIANLTATNTTAGDIAITENDAINVLSAINSAADILIATGGGMMTVTTVDAKSNFVATVADTPGPDDDIVVLGAVESDDSMSLSAGDDITLGVASNVKSINNIVFVNVDSASADAAGGTAIFAGAISGNNTLQYPIFVQGNVQDDLFSIQKMPLSAIAIVAGGGTLDNTFILLTNAAERVNVFATIVDVVGRPLITYVGNEQLDIVTQGGDDKVFVQMPEPIHGILANIVRVNTGAGDDSLKINGSSLADVIRVASYTTNPIYRFQVLDAECLQVFGFNNNDTIENSAPVSSLLDGGNGIDHITGNDFAALYDVIFGGGDIDVLLGRSGGDFLYADHDYNFGSPVQLFANGDLLNGGPGSDVIIALGGDAIVGDVFDIANDLIVGGARPVRSNVPGFAQSQPEAGTINHHLRRGLAKRCAIPMM